MRLDKSSKPRHRPQLTRRTALKTAAWLSPTIIFAVSAPAASASPLTSAAIFAGSSSQISLSILGGGSLANIGTPVTFPNNLTITNGPGPLTGPITGQISVNYISGLPLNISLTGNATARGFFVSSLPGAEIKTTNVTRKVLRTVPILGLTFGVYETNQTFTLVDSSIPSNATRILDGIVYGVTTKQSTLGLSAAVTFSVTVALFDGQGVSIGTANGTITVPLNASVL